MQGQQISFFAVKPRSRTKLQKRKTHHQDLDLVKPTMIDPLFFSSMKVFVDLTDEIQKKIVENVLRVTGASIINDPLVNPDVIVTDDFRKIYNRQAKIVNSTQIPWAFITKPLNNINVSNNNNNNSIQQQQKKRMLVVVADTSHQTRPMYTELENFPELRMKFIPPGCMFSPFLNDDEANKIIDAFKKNKNRNINKERISNPTYCNICNKHFTDAEEHRNSLPHKRNVAKMYANVDKIAMDFPDLF